MVVEAPKTETPSATPQAAPAPAPDGAAKDALKATEAAHGDRIELRQDIDSASKPAPAQETQSGEETPPPVPSPDVSDTEEEPNAEEQSFSDSISTFYNAIKLSSGSTWKAVMATMGFAFSMGPMKLWNFLKNAWNGEDENEGTKGKAKPDAKEKPRQSIGKTLLENIQSLLKEFGITETADARKNYFLIAVELAKEVEAKYGVPYEVCVAQSCLETGFGTSDLVKRSFNAFGLVKNKSYMKFGSLRESFMAYGERLTTNSIYKKAFEFKDDPLRFLEEVKAAGYAEDPGYVGKVRGVAKEFGLSF